MSPRSQTVTVKFRNDTDGVLVFPTLEPPVELEPGEEIDLPDVADDVADQPSGEE